MVDGRAIALGGVKQRALLALLVLHANEVVSRDALIDELWGERPPLHAEHSIVVYVSRLRKALAAPGADELSTLGTEAGGYVLRVDPAQIDVQRFERGLEQAGRALAAGAVRDAADMLRGVCAEWRGSPLSDLATEPFAEGESSRLEELRLAALGSRIDAELLLGRHAELVPELESLVRRNPLNERLCAQLMVALYRSGRQARALEVYQTTRRFLVDELGIEPGENLERLQRAILRHDRELEPPTISRAAGAPPAGAARASSDGALIRPSRRQRKTVSVLAATLRPSPRGDADVESLGLEQDRYFAALKVAIERHGGTVIRLGGDASLGFFGVPAVHEDDALRAARAAAEMRDAAGSLTEILTGQGAIPLELGVGVDTGQVVTGTDGPSVPGGQSVTGLAVTLATEMARAAEAGEILLGTETVRRLASAVDVEPHPPVVVRGQAAPLQAFRFRQLTADTWDAGRPELDSAFVGRSAELKAVRAAFEQAVAERGPRLVTVVGEPGIGKTRLLAEFTSTLSGEARVLGGRCLPYGDGITYWPMVGILRELGGPGALAEALAADEQGERVRELILGAGDVALPPTIEALLAARLDRLPTAERDLLERAAVEGLVFHRGAVTALLPPGERADAGAHLLGAIRRDLVRPQPADLPGEDGFRFVHVLVRDAVYGAMPKELRAELHEAFAAWLEGHGATLLELDELLGYHLEQAALYRRELGLPDGGLAERAGERLATAGRRALWRGDEAAAASLLGRALELTRPIRLDVHLEVDLAYAVGFDHPQRAAAIAEAAATLARTAGDEPGEALARVAWAYHRALTGEGDVDEVEALARSAVPSLEAVGDHAGLARVWGALGFEVAQVRGRFEEMAEASEQALRHARLAGQRPGDALENLAMALADGPRPADEALHALEVILPENPRPGLLMWRAYVLAMLDRSEDARPSPGRLCELMREVGSTPGEGMAGTIAAFQGDHETAVGYLRAMCHVLKERGQRNFLASFALILGRELCALGRYDEAEPLARLGRDTGGKRDVLNEMWWRQVQALLDAHHGNGVEADKLAREAVAIGEQTDSLNAQAAALCDLAEVLRAAAKDAEAADALAQALGRYERKRNLAMARQVRALLKREAAAAV